MDLYCCIVNALHTAALNVIPVTRASGTADEHNIPGGMILLKQRTLMLGTHLSSGLDLVNPGRARCLILCEFSELSLSTCCVNVDERRLLFELIFLPAI